MSNFFLTLDACTNPEILKIILFVTTLLKYVCYIIPAGLILMVTLDFSKNVISMKEEDFQKNLNLALKRIIYGVCVFLVPTIAEATMNLADSSIWANYTACLSNTAYISYYEELDKLKKEELQKEINDWYNSLDTDSKFKSTVLKLTKKSSSTDGSYNGQTYKLSDEQLDYLAAVSEQEQGAAGAGAEASLMANLFELNGSESGTGADGLVNYVKTSGWFGKSRSASGASQEAKDAVKAVLVLGQRTLPLYVDEHDCWLCNTSNYCSNGLKGDICTVDGSTDVTNKSLYIKDKTIIKNVYSSTYTFYTFPTDESDPFGYTQASYDKIKNAS